MAGTSFGGVIDVNAGWYGFCFAGPGSSATDGCQNSGIGTAGNPVTFTATGPVLFQITDAFFAGDNFLVDIDGGAIVFTTPSAFGGPSFWPGPDSAYASLDFSHYSQALAAGPHTVNISVASSVLPAGGAGYLRVITDESAVPEPASLALAAIGLGLMALRRVRTKQ